MSSSDQLEQKKAAASAAAQLLSNGMVVGLGSGTTAELAVAAIGARVKQGLQITGIPTSEKTADLARQLGIPLTTLEECPKADITIDGADEIVLETLDLIKGGGGNQLREKLVAVASAQMVVVADSGKVVDQLGASGRLPVEIVKFGWRSTWNRLEKLGAKPTLRLANGGDPYITDGGNYILDCNFGLIASPQDLQLQLDQVVGVVEHGLFLGIATKALVAGPSGIEIFSR